MKGKKQKIEDRRRGSEERSEERITFRRSLSTRSIDLVYGVAEPLANHLQRVDSAARVLPCVSFDRDTIVACTRLRCDLT